MTHKEFFDQRGIDPELAQKLGVRLIENGVEFPNGDIYRTRPFEGNRKIYQPRGAKLMPWFLTPPAENDGFLVCEGETDALAAASQLTKVDRICVISIPGAATPPRRLIRMLPDPPVTVRLAFDGDEAGAKATQRFSDALYEAGYYPLVLPIPAGEDLASYLVKAPIPAVRMRRLINCASLYPLLP